MCPAVPGSIPVLLRSRAAAVAAAALGEPALPRAADGGRGPRPLPRLTRNCIYLPEDETRGLAERDITQQRASPDEGGRQQ